MKTIASFKINHDTLEKGVYVSRIDGDAVTYDLRMKKPNNGDFITPKSLHTIEHLLATYVRNSEFSESIIYAGPMGCRSGFYLIVRDNVSKKDVLLLVKKAMAYISDFTGIIPGSGKKECGNYLEHDLEAAKKDAAEYLEAILDLTENDMTYKD